MARPSINKDYSLHFNLQPSEIQRRLAKVNGFKGLICEDANFEFEIYGHNSHGEFCYFLAGMDFPIEQIRKLHLVWRTSDIEAAILLREAENAFNEITYRKGSLGTAFNFNQIYCERSFWAGLEFSMLRAVKQTIKNVMHGEINNSFDSD
jgi:hypothetical protein